VGVRLLHLYIAELLDCLVRWRKHQASTKTGDKGLAAFNAVFQGQLEREFSASLAAANASERLLGGMRDKD